MVTTTRVGTGRTEAPLLLLPSVGARAREYGPSRPRKRNVAEWKCVVGLTFLIDEVIVLAFKGKVHSLNLDLMASW